MVTKTGKKICAIPTNYNWIFGGATVACIKAKAGNGTEYNISTLSTDNSVALITSAYTATGSNASYGVALGTGTTPATEDDYQMENMITSLTTSATPTVTGVYNPSTGVYRWSVDYSLSNNTANDIVVSEVGRFCRGYSATNLGDSVSAGVGNRASYLIDHTVLDIPITVPANGAALLRYSFEYQMDIATT